MAAERDLKWSALTARMPSNSCLSDVLLADFFFFSELILLWGLFRLMYCTQVNTSDSEDWECGRKWLLRTFQNWIMWVFVWMIKLLRCSLLTFNERDLCQPATSLLLSASTARLLSRIRNNSFFSCITGWQSSACYPLVHAFYLASTVTGIHLYFIHTLSRGFKCKP